MAGKELATQGIATVFGAGGFLGRYVIRALAARGYRIRAGSRRPNLSNYLQPMGRVGQIVSVQANLRYPASLAASLREAELAVNLVGVLTESGRQNFEAVHVFGARAAARAAREAGVRRYVHVSAIGAQADSQSLYARTKARGEEAVREIYPDAVILRPSILFGPEDDFFNRFAAMARIAPVLPLMGGGHTRFQPAYVGDVAEAVGKVADGVAKDGGTYELGGPDVKTFKELLEYICKVTGRNRLLLPVPFGAARLPAAATETADALLFGLFPKMLVMTRDQLKLLESDNVVADAAVRDGSTLSGLGIDPRAIDSVVPTYLYRFRKAGQFDSLAT